MKHTVGFGVGTGVGLGVGSGVGSGVGALCLKKFNFFLRSKHFRKNQNKSYGVGHIAC